jgi:hypothetical protein
MGRTCNHPSVSFLSDACAAQQVGARNRNVAIVKHTREGGALWQVDGREPLEHATPVKMILYTTRIRIQVRIFSPRRETIWKVTMQRSRLTNPYRTNRTLDHALITQRRAVAHQATHRTTVFRVVVSEFQLYQYERFFAIICIVTCESNALRVKLVGCHKRSNVRVLRTLMLTSAATLHVYDLPESTSARRERWALHVSQDLVGFE